MLCAVGGIIRQNPHKDTQAVLAEFTVGCHQAQVRILARGALIVVTRTHLRDKARLVADAPRNDQQLGMYLVLTKAIDDVDAGLLKPLGPDNIVFLIEACAQLDDDMDLLAVSAALISAATIWLSRATRYSVILIDRTAGSSAASSSSAMNGFMLSNGYDSIISWSSICGISGLPGCTISLSCGISEG